MEATNFAMPGASDAYRTARMQLLEAERDIRDRIERVAALRRALPPGPKVREYEFFDGDARVKLSDLFASGKPYLAMYHLMYWQDDREFCPMCSMWVDGWDGVAHHVEQRANVVVASLAPPEELLEWKAHRKWQRIRVLADADESFACDTGAQDGDGDPVSTVLVFEKKDDGIYHVLTMHPEFLDDTHRGIDQLCPTWHILDLLPAGRGDWNAGNDYV